MGNVNEYVLQRLERVFGTPRHTQDLAGFYDEYERALGFFSDDVLEAAMNRVIDGHTTTFWPAPGVIRRACESALPISPPNYSRAEPSQERNPMVAERIDRMVKQAIAKINAGIAERALPPPPAGTDREKWAEMIRKTPNRDMHGLTKISRRITGEDR